MLTTTTAIIVPESFDPANPQDVGPARSPVPTIRDRSAKQRALSLSTPARPFVSQCVDVNAGGPLETLIYVCLAARCRAFVDGDTGTCRIGRERLRADTKMSLTAFENHHAALLATGLVSVKRTGRTSIYTVRTVGAQLRASNANDPEEDREPWKAAGVSRRTWYRNSETGGEPTNTHGGARRQSSGTPWIAAGVSRSAWYRKTPRKDGEVGFSSGTDTPREGVSDTPREGVSTEEGSQGVQRTKRRARASCSDCGRTWPAEYGTVCHTCGDRPQRHDAARRPNDKPANPDGYTGTLIRNCPQCHVLERGYTDRCQSCDWTRAAWEADEQATRRKGKAR